MTNLKQVVTETLRKKQEDFASWEGEIKENAIAALKYNFYNNKRLHKNFADTVGSLAPKLAKDLKYVAMVMEDGNKLSEIFFAGENKGKVKHEEVMRAGWRIFIYYTLGLSNEFDTEVNTIKVGLEELEYYHVAAEAMGLEVKDAGSLIPAKERDISSRYIQVVDKIV